MTFFENELRKIIEPLKLGAVYVGGKTAYISLGNVKFRIDLWSMGISSHWNSLMVRVINPQSNEVDRNIIQFSDVWGKKPTTNPNFRDGIYPHAWTDGDKTNWYVYHPTESDYKILTNEVKKLVDIYR